MNTCQCNTLSNAHMVFLQGLNNVMLEKGQIEQRKNPSNGTKLPVGILYVS